MVTRFTVTAYLAQLFAKVRIQSVWTLYFHSVFSKLSGYLKKCHGKKISQRKGKKQSWNSFSVLPYSQEVESTFVRLMVTYCQILLSENSSFWEFKETALMKWFDTFHLLLSLYRADDRKKTALCCICDEDWMTLLSQNVSVHAVVLFERELVLFL